MTYNDILLLKDLLEKEEIPFDFDTLFGGFIIAYPSKEECVCSVIEHDYSYGNSSDLLEIRGLLTKEESEFDDVVGYLTALDVYDRIKVHWNKNKDIIKELLYCEKWEDIKEYRE